MVGHDGTHKAMRDVKLHTENGREPESEFWSSSLHEHRKERNDACIRRHTIAYDISFAAMTMTTTPMKFLHMTHHR